MHSILKGCSLNMSDKKVILIKMVFFVFLKRKTHFSLINFKD